MRLTRYRAALGSGLALAVLIVASLLLRGPVQPPLAVTVVQLGSTNTPWEIHPGLGGALFVLPDGSLWIWGRSGSLASRETPRRLDPGHDWKMAIGGNGGIVALKTNGELWQAGWDGVTAAPSSKLSRIGLDSDWSWVAKSDTAAAALKHDGSLWTWGAAVHASALGDPAVASRSDPGRVGTQRWQHLGTDGSNWGFVGLTADGQLQAWGQPFQPGATFPKPRPIHPATNWVAASTRLFLDAQGGLWGGPLNPFQDVAVPGNIGLLLTNAAPGRYAQAGLALYTIEPDGTLHRHRHPGFLGLVAQSAGPEGRLGNRADWVKLWSGGGIVLGLTREGTLWHWGTDPGATPVPSLPSRLKLRLVDGLNHVLRFIRASPLSAGTTVAYSPVVDEPRPLFRLLPPTSPP